MRTSLRLSLQKCRIAAAFAGLVLTACGEPADATTGAPVEGSGSGSGSEEAATCWLAGVPVEKCPVQPRGNLPADCPSGRVFESADFAPGTGPCVPSMPDWECPAGWRSVPGFTDGSGNEDVPEGMTQFSVCEPPEGSGTVGAPELPPTPTDCPAGTIAVPGDVACRPMGSPCPTAAERWASEADLRARAPGYDGPVVYVAADAAVDGAGTRTSPRPLGSAAVRAAQNGLLALALGDYPSGVRLDRKVALLGACVAGTTLRSSLPFALTGILDLVGGGAALVRDLTLSGSRPGITVNGSITDPHRIAAVMFDEATGVGLLLASAQAVEGRDLRIERTRPLADGTFGRGIDLAAGASLTLMGATLRNNQDLGLFANGVRTTVEATGLLIEDTQPQASDQASGRGIGVQGGAALTLTGATLRNNHEIGLFADGVGTTVSATVILIENTQPRASDQTFGDGVVVSEGASLTLTGVTLRNNHDVGLGALGVGTTVNAAGLLIEDTQPDASDQTGGRAITAQAGASLTLTGATLRNNHEVGLFASDVGTTVESTGLLVEDTQPQASDQTAGRGVVIRVGASLTLRGASLRNNHDVGLTAFDAGTTVSATGLLIENTQPQASDQASGRGIGAQGGAALTLTDAILRNNHDIGLLASGSGSTVTATGLIVEDTQPQASDQMRGRGLDVEAGASLTIAGATLRNNHEIGLFADGVGTTVEATGLLIEDTQPQASDKTGGRGISVQLGVALTLTGATLRNNLDLGLFAYGIGTTVTAMALLVAATQPQASDGLFGDGLLLTEGASLTGTDMTLWENARCGLQVAFEGVSVAVQRALIGRNLIGTNLQSSDFTRDDLAVGLRGETYWENGLDLGAESLPIPDPVEALESLDPIAP